MTINKSALTASLPTGVTSNKRVESIDTLRGIVMILMALDHVRDYFHKEAFIFSPTDLSHTTFILFFTRWITHFCAPVFVFLAGISAYLYGAKRGRKQLSFFLLTRGAWLMVAELLIVTLGWTFNPLYHLFNLQVIWSTGLSMILLSVIIRMNRHLILITGILLIAAHNLLDGIHVPGNGIASFLWAILHEPGAFKVGYFTFSINYPVLPWIGIIVLGYYVGVLYSITTNPEKRRNILLLTGLAAILLFIVLRSGNFYGDAHHWSVQKNAIFSLMSFLNVTKYPPSLLYILMTLGPALVFLSLFERHLNKWSTKIIVFGRVPMFYYLVHIFLVHLLAIAGAIIAGYKWSDMILSTRVNSAPQLIGYGFNLATVYITWIAVVLILYPLCKRFSRYKTLHQSAKWWLNYL